MARTNTLSSGPVDAITGSGDANQIAYFDGASSIAGDSRVTFNPALPLLTVGIRLGGGKGTDTAAANDLLLPLNGNVFTITGNTTINAIRTNFWPEGSTATLYFTGTPTVKHNTAGGSETEKIFLAGSVDLAAIAGTVLGLVYMGSTGWQECFRKFP